MCAPVEKGRKKQFRDNITYLFFQLWVRGCYSAAGNHRPQAINLTKKNAGVSSMICQEYRFAKYS